MKISLITSAPDTAEVQRIKEEAEKLHHNLEVVSIKGVGFSIKNSNLQVPQLSNINSDVVIVRGVYRFIRELSVFLEEFRKRGIKVYDNGLSNHQYAIDKITDTIRLSLNNIPMPTTVHARTFEGLKEMCDENFDYPYILKYTNKGKGAGVYKIESEDAINKIIKEMESKKKRPRYFLAQEYVDYVHDLRVLVMGDRFYTMKRIPPKDDFRANFSLGGSVELFKADDGIKELAKKAVEASLLSVAGVDVLIDKSGQHTILEVNHNPGFKGMEKATNENIAKLYLEHAIESAE